MSTRIRWIAEYETLKPDDFTTRQITDVENDLSKQAF
jgi:hypothetical protein